MMTLQFTEAVSEARKQTGKATVYSHHVRSKYFAKQSKVH
jgi:hypothetical protein